MNQTDSIKLKFEGDAVENSTIDAKLLATTLLALDSLIHEANRIANDNRVKIHLEITATSPGSFYVDINLVQTWVKHLLSYLNNQPLDELLKLKDIIFGDNGVISFLKWLHKKTNIKIEKECLDTNNLLITSADGSSIQIPQPVYMLSKNVQIRREIKNFSSGVMTQGIESISISSSSSSIDQKITEPDLDAFNLPEQEEKILSDTIQEHAYSIVSLTFKKENKWKLSDGNSTISASIKDDQFLEQISSNETSFRKDDLLICKIRVIQKETTDGIKTDYEVLEVLEQRTHNQLSLFD